MDIQNSQSSDSSISYSVFFETFNEEGFFFSYFFVMKSSEKGDTVER